MKKGALMGMAVFMIMIFLYFVLNSDVRIGGRGDFLRNHGEEVGMIPLSNGRELILGGENIAVHFEGGLSDSLRDFILEDFNRVFGHLTLGKPDRFREPQARRGSTIPLFYAGFEGPGRFIPTQLMDMGFVSSEGHLVVPMSVIDSYRYAEAFHQNHAHLRRSMIEFLEGVEKARKGGSRSAPLASFFEMSNHEAASQISGSTVEIFEFLRDGRVREPSVLGYEDVIFDHEKTYAAKTIFIREGAGESESEIFEIDLIYIRRSWRIVFGIEII